jgi:hypothetical protein
MKCKLQVLLGTQQVRHNHTHLICTPMWTNLTLHSCICEAQWSPGRWSGISHLWDVWATLSLVKLQYLNNNMIENMKYLYHKWYFRTNDPSLQQQPKEPFGAKIFWSHFTRSCSAPFISWSGFLIRSDSFVLHINLHLRL